MTSTRSITFIAVLLAGLVAVGMLAAPAAATEHSTTLAGDDTDVIDDFNASDDRFVEYDLDADDTDFGTDTTETVHLNVTVDDEHVTVSEDVDDADAAYTFNVSHDELATVPGDANSTATITVNAWGEDSDGNVSTSVDTFEADLEFTDDYAVVYVGDAAAAGDVTGLDVETDDPEGILATLGLQSESMTVDADAVGLGNTSEGTTVNVIVANQTNDAFEQASEKRFGSFSEGDFLRAHALSVEGHYQAVFHEDAPIDDLADGYTYAETTEINGHDAYRIHVDEDFSGEDTVDVSASANDALNFVSAFQVQRTAFDGTIGALTAGLLLFGAVARREA